MSELQEYKKKNKKSIFRFKIVTNKKTITFQCDNPKRWINFLLMLKNCFTFFKKLFFTSLLRKGDDSDSIEIFNMRKNYSPILVVQNTKE